MPVSVIVGGQFGSEGKGKVALEMARLRDARIAIRVGGPNSGHTAIGSDGKPFIFRHLPTAALLPDVVCVVAAGSYLNAEVLVREIALAGLGPERVVIDPNAVLITEEHREWERASALRERIGSTLSGTGAAVAARVERRESLAFAADEPRLRDFVRPVTRRLRSALDEGARIIIEGTQGFGLSLLHSGYFPRVTSRDTTAAAFVAEAGLSPLDVDEVVLVIRAFPIRVPGDSGELADETDWDTITRESGSAVPLIEHASATGRVRRVARFDPRIVKRAIDVNAPTLVCLNHLDYVDAACCATQTLSDPAKYFLSSASDRIAHRIHYIGLGPSSMIPIPQHL